MINENEPNNPLECLFFLLWINTKGQKIEITPIIFWEEHPYDRDRKRIVIEAPRLEYPGGIYWLLKQLDEKGIAKQSYEYEEGEF
jgi:hypothetical protein